mmetsp:Transcript_95182/g.246442  ORF Transcript_95182/g.246442 Transcript_95182/m.246442 type:complete len:301 (-) Transcript_95182:303-1205(-)
MEKKEREKQDLIAKVENLEVTVSVLKADIAEMQVKLKCMSEDCEEMEQRRSEKRRRKRERRRNVESLAETTTQEASSSEMFEGESVKEPLSQHKVEGRSYEGYGEVNEIVMEKSRSAVDGGRLVHRTVDGVARDASEAGDALLPGRQGRRDRKCARRLGRCWFCGVQGHHACQCWWCHDARYQHGGQRQRAVEINCVEATPSPGHVGREAMCSSSRAALVPCVEGYEKIYVHMVNQVRRISNDVVEKTRKDLQTLLNTLRDGLVQISAGGLRWKLDKQRQEMRCMYVETALPRGGRGLSL